MLKLKPLMLIFLTFPIKKNRLTPYQNIEYQPHILQSTT